MSTQQGINITLTTDRKQMEVCAGMMASTDPWITLGISFEQCLSALEGPCKELYILQMDGEIAGFVLLQVCGSFRGYIQTLCIDQRFRGKGLGTTLLQFCETRILKISPNIFICVSSFNKGALKLYLDFGFKLVGELENFITEGYTELLLRKTVGPINGYIPG